MGRKTRKPKKPKYQKKPLRTRKYKKQNKRLKSRKSHKGGMLRRSGRDRTIKTTDQIESEKSTHRERNEKAAAKTRKEERRKKEEERIKQARAIILQGVREQVQQLTEQRKRQHIFDIIENRGSMRGAETQSRTDEEKLESILKEIAENETWKNEVKDDNFRPFVRFVFDYYNTYHGFPPDREEITHENWKLNVHFFDIIVDEFMRAPQETEVQLLKSILPKIAKNETWKNEVEHKNFQPFVRYLLRYYKTNREFPADRDDITPENWREIAGEYIVGLNP